jgi:hypothetical protein
VSLDHDLTRQVRRLDEYDLRRLLIFAGGLLSGRTGEAVLSVEAAPAEHARPPASGRARRAGPEGTGPEGVTLRQERVRCGKKGCTRCPHGPYWYAYWREDGRLRSRYVGKELPRALHGTTPA